MPVVNTTNTFTNNEQITSTKLNNIMDNSSFVSGAVVTSGGLEVTAGGQMQIASDGVTTARILNSNVTTAKIADGAVTPEKLSANAPSWASGTTFLQPGLELGNSITTNGNSYIDFHSSFPVIDYDCRVIRNPGVNGIFEIFNQGTGAIKLSASGGVTFGPANMPNPVGNAPIFGVRAWANINGTVGSVSVRQGGNVSGVVRDQLGRYTITFATPMQDTNYAITAWARDANATDNNYFVSAASNATKTTSSFQIEVNSPGGTVDSPEINIMVIR
jgi:hypothetical protein